MQFKIKSILIAFTFFCTLGCSSVTIDLKEPASPINLKSPSLKDYRAFYFWGLLQARHVSVGKACLDQVPVRVRSSISGEDFTLALFTLGIYSSKTVEVWCEDQKTESAQL